MTAVKQPLKSETVATAAATAAAAAAATIPCLINQFSFPSTMIKHPQEALLAQFSPYVHKGGLKPDSFHFISLP